MSIFANHGYQKVNVGAISLVGRGSKNVDNEKETKILH